MVHHDIVSREVFLASMIAGVDVDESTTSGNKIHEESNRASSGMPPPRTAAIHRYPSAMAGALPMTIMIMTMTMIVAHRPTAQREILLWMTPSEAPIR